MAAWGHTMNKVRTGKRKAPFGAEGGGEEAAKAIVEVLERFDESQRNASATKGDLRETELRLLKEIQQAKAETIKWVAGIITAQTVAIIAAIIALMK
jgi:hypothetical protein